MTFKSSQSASDQEMNKTTVTASNNWFLAIHTALYCQKNWTEVLLSKDVFHHPWMCMTERPSTADPTLTCYY